MSILNTKVMTNQGRQTMIQALQNYGKRLSTFIRSRVNSDEDAEDIAQEVWFQLSRVIDTEPIEQMSGWLYRVARNRIIDSYRKQKPGRFPEHIDEFDDETGLLSGEAISPYDDPDFEVLYETFWQEFFAALEELPEKQKEVLLLNEMDNLTYEEISRRTGENIKTLMSRKRYAVQFLQERLEGFYEEFINQSVNAK